MVQEDLLIKVIGKINQLRIPYMITGGIASIFYGKPRLTHDFDIVAEIEEKDIVNLVTIFKGEFYVSLEAIQNAIENRSMFNIIHFDSGIKIDFWLLKDDEFDRKRFERRKQHIYSGRDIFFSTPEDIILKKLVWFKESEIQKHFDDALSVFEIQKDLDVDYLTVWAEKLSIQALLDDISSIITKEI
ncbi:hypothetical protein ES703_25216 [subsurface metagenome]